MVLMMQGTADDVRDYIPYCSFKAEVAFAELAKTQNIKNLRQFLIYIIILKRKQ